MGTRRRRLAGAGLLLFNAVALPSCTSKSLPAAETAPSDLTAYVSIKELMQNMIDPIADNIFDAVGTDVTAKGVVDTKPVTDDDWAKVRQGAVTLAESTNLLKMPRPVAPPGDTNKSIGPNAPELSPEQIQAKIDQDRALWNRHVNQMRDDALKVLAIVKAKDVDALFQAGSDIDRACETCHLEYWYPGDKKAVLEDERQRATITPPKKK
ncbi:MAG: hypothetical protein ABJA98_35695 [Acidobacteriota bacterium]